MTIFTFIRCSLSRPRRDVPAANTKTTATRHGFIGNEFEFRAADQSARDPRLRTAHLPGDLDAGTRYAAGSNEENNNPEPIAARLVPTSTRPFQDSSVGQRRERTMRYDDDD